MKAIWNDQLIAESDDVIKVEGNIYFPIVFVKMEFLKESNTQTTCPWKGSASYYSLNVNGKTNEDAAWYYPEPKSAAEEIRGRLAFWKGVQIVDD
ncbi:MAG: DUF427 domain-containing protein [Bacteroidales bacterium]|jgi:uncharacterized protein (DUF427 family)|nr:DUF427 domain-containing protein [Bacteroidales bacterium]